MSRRQGASPCHLPPHRLYGTGHDVVVLLCGFQATQACWRPVVPRLLPRTTAITLDNRGAGPAPFIDQTLSIEDMAQDVLRLLDQLGVRRFFLAGHSMGIAQVIARRRPDRVRALALCNSFRKLGNDSAAALARLRNELDGGIEPNEIWSALSGSCFSGDPLRHAAAELVGRDMRRQHAIPGFRRQLDALLAFDSRPWLHEVAAPTLLVSSQADRSALGTEAAAMARQLRGADHLVLAGGHMSMIEQPGALGQSLLSFFVRHAAV